MFDSGRALRDFQKHLILYIAKIREELLLDTQSGMNTPEGRMDLSNGDIKIIAEYVFASITGGTWAMMDEWGTGSLMDKDNPALANYQSSKYWNPARHDFAIRGRPAGGYTNIFGKSARSNGGMRGVNLEKLAEEGKLPADYLPKPPSYAMKTAFRWMANGRFQWYLQKAVVSFPWGKYLKITNTKG